MATVWWKDTGAKVVLRRMEADARLRVATKNALAALMES